MPGRNVHLSLFNVHLASLDSLVNLRLNLVKRTALSLLLPQDKLISFEHTTNLRRQFIVLLRQSINALLHLLCDLQLLSRLLF